MDKGEISVEYCPTHLMLADIFTKPLNGKLYHTFRDIVMGYKPIFTLQDETFLFKERVGNINKNEKVSKTSNKETMTLPRNTTHQPTKTYAEVVRSNLKKVGK